MTFEVHGKAPVEVGFNEVVLPDLSVKPPLRDRRTRDSRAEAPDAGTPHLLLRRGVTGALDLYRWFDEARAGRRGRPDPGRTVIVRLMAEDRSTVVLAWRFAGTRPVRIAWSPLRAQSADLVIETLELSFVRMDVE